MTRDFTKGRDGGHVLFHYAAGFDAEALLDAFEDVCRAPANDLITNFLGVRYDPDVFPSLLGRLRGAVEGRPEPGTWHADIAEWAGCLLTVQRADQRYSIVEVGCGWGCWLNNMGYVASKRGLDIKLVGIEGDASHLESARRVLAYNGLRDKAVKLVHGVAAPRSGYALFPRSTPGENWGAEPIFYPSENQIETLNGTSHDLIRCYTLEELSDGQPVDLLHIDIQGAEFDFVRENWDHINQLVKHVFVGTHSRVLDGKLAELFLEGEWRIEIERPTVHVVEDGFFSTRIDGAQLWRNPVLLGF